MEQKDIEQIKGGDILLLELTDKGKASGLYEDNPCGYLGEVFAFIDIDKAKEFDVDIGQGYSTNFQFSKGGISTSGYWRILENLGPLDARKPTPLSSSGTPSQVGGPTKMYIPQHPVALPPSITSNIPWNFFTDPSTPIRSGKAVERETLLRRLSALESKVNHALGIKRSPSPTASLKDTGRRIRPALNSLSRYLGEFLTDISIQQANLGDIKTETDKLLKPDHVLGGFGSDLSDEEELAIHINEVEEALDDIEQSIKGALETVQYVLKSLPT